MILIFSFLKNVCLEGWCASTNCMFLFLQPIRAVLTEFLINESSSNFFFNEHSLVNDDLFLASTAVSVQTEKVIVTHQVDEKYCERIN